MGDTAYIAKPWKCDFCENEAHFDAKTKLGPWAALCDAHFEIYGIALGTGMGQRLIVSEKPNPTAEE